MEPLHSPDPINSYMRQHKLSQKEFATKMGVSQSAVSQWLTGRKSISIRTAEQIEKRSAGKIRVRALFPKLFAKAA